jgi:hypothetical protein
VSVNDTVAWRNTGGVHNVKFDDGSFEKPAEPSPALWRESRTFSAAGSFRYYCEEHGGPNGAGMAGTIVVQDAGMQPPPDTQPPAITAFTLRRAARRSIRAAFSVSEGGTATLTLRRKVGRRFRRVRTVRRGVRAGRTALRIRRDRRGRRLRAGRYRASLRVRDAAGNLSSERRASVTLR